MMLSGEEPMRGIDARSDKQYLGDGVYLSFDGYYIWLTTDAGDIALEPSLLPGFDAYRRMLDAKYKVDRHAPRPA